MSDEAARLLSGEAWRDFCRRLEAVGEATLGEAYRGNSRFSDMTHCRRY